ncbi:MAG: serine/threonine-protein phosphatase, partial [Fibrobacter sp.]|nr:serine/threonine-protein phosphatase [Fibrobacter sp.]
ATGGARQWIDPTGPAVGIIPDAQFTRNEILLAPGEMLFTYTDGVTEARNLEGELFSKKRLSYILDSKFSDVSEAVKTVEHSVQVHSCGKPPTDDITMLAVRRKS